MTSQTYHTNDDQVVLETSLIDPDADLAVAEAPLAEAPLAEAPLAEAPLAEPDPDLAMAEAPLAEAPLAEPDPDLAMAEAPLAEPAAPADHASGNAPVSDEPAFFPDGDAVEGPEMADSSPASPALAPAVMVPESAPESHVAVMTAHVAGPWNEVQAMFVDDPRASIERAAGLVNDQIEVLIESVRERQRSLTSAWQVDDVGTEVLRVALQHYRSFWNSLENRTP
jgi:hypothetical protein